MSYINMQHNILLVLELYKCSFTYIDTGYVFQILNSKEGYKYSLSHYLHQNRQ